MKSKFIPKVLLPIDGQPMIKKLLNEVNKVDKNPIVVIGKNQNLVKEAVGANAEYVEQSESLGTGHAVQCVIDKFGKFFSGPLLIIYGDHPFLTNVTIKKIFCKHTKNNSDLTLTTVFVPSDGPWVGYFKGNGRIIRDDQGQVKEIIEAKDATPEQLAIKERNASYLCFNSYWLWENISKINNNNAQGEYYLTDMIKIACDQQARIMTQEVRPLEAVGINTPEEYQEALKISK